MSFKEELKKAYNKSKLCENTIEIESIKSFLLSSAELGVKSVKYPLALSNKLEHNTIVWLNINELKYTIKREDFMPFDEVFISWE